MGRTIWGAVGLGVFGLDTVAAEALRQQRASSGAPPLYTSTRSHSSPVVNECFQHLQPCEVLRLGGSGHKVCASLSHPNITLPVSYFLPIQHGEEKMQSGHILFQIFFAPFTLMLIVFAESSKIITLAISKCYGNVRALFSGRQHSRFTRQVAQFTRSWSSGKMFAFQPRGFVFEPVRIR